MSQDHRTDAVPPYPRPAHEGRPERWRGWTPLIVIAGVLATGGLLVGGFLFVLYAFNPMGDEWICSDGETPAGQAPFYNHCYTNGATLPAGYTWDPYGNRPMPSNCDKGGWMKVTRPTTFPGMSGFEDDCVKDGTPLPEGWSERD